MDLSLPNSWTDKGMDWENPDPFSCDYWNAIILATNERLWNEGGYLNTVYPSCSLGPSPKEIYGRINSLIISRQWMNPGFADADGLEFPEIPVGYFPYEHLSWPLIEKKLGVSLVPPSPNTLIDSEQTRNFMKNARKILNLTTIKRCENSIYPALTSNPFQLYYEQKHYYSKSMELTTSADPYCKESFQKEIAELWNQPPAEAEEPRGMKTADVSIRFSSSNDEIKFSGSYGWKTFKVTDTTNCGLKCRPIILCEYSARKQYADNYAKKKTYSAKSIQSAKEFVNVSNLKLPPEVPEAPDDPTNEYSEYTLNIRVWDFFADFAVPGGYRFQ